MWKLASLEVVIAQVSLFLFLPFGGVCAVNLVLVSFQKAQDLLNRGLLILMGPSVSRDSNSYLIMCIKSKSVASSGY